MLYSLSLVVWRGGALFVMYWSSFFEFAVICHNFLILFPWIHHLLPSLLCILSLPRFLIHFDLSRQFFPLFFLLVLGRLCCRDDISRLDVSCLDEADVCGTVGRHAGRVVGQKVLRRHLTFEAVPA